MVPFFLNPIAFAALAAIPVLAGLYWLRNRFRPYPVSSLLLWVDLREARAGGRRVERMQKSILFILELLAILLIVLAAAGPQFRLAQSARPLVIVLDDSYSMLAGAPDSARARALTAISEELRATKRASIRFILAGEHPQLFGNVSYSTGEALDVLQQWHCQAPTARLEAAITLAYEVGGEHSVLLVITDQQPPTASKASSVRRDERSAATIVPEKGRLQWRAFGKRRPNLAFVNAARTARDSVDRCLLEVANLWPLSQTTTLVITAGEAGSPEIEVQRSTLSLEPNETRRLILEVKAGTPTMHAHLADDDLVLDNDVWLPPSVRRTVRVEIRIADESIRRPVEKALRSIPNALLTQTAPDLILTDSDITTPTQSWIVRLLAEKEAESYTGPFVVDRTHPLADGLGLRGAVWGAGKGKQLRGVPIVAAGNVPLVMDNGGPTGRHDLVLCWRPDLSTVQDSPSWPILFTNLINWNADLAPGLDRTTVRLGEEVTLTLPEHHETVLVVQPGGALQTLPVQGRQAIIRADQPGLFEVRAGKQIERFAVNTLRQEESDLTNCMSGRWGDWRDETALRFEYQDVGWALLLAALAVLTLHLFLAHRAVGAP